jgi:hypothetical protein
MGNKRQLHNRHNPYKGTTMKLDGYDLYVGDKIYDLALKQWAVVKEVRENSFIAAVKNTTHTYFTDGMRNDRKAAFWHEPLLIIPPKDVGKWNRESKAYTQIVGAVNTLSGA